MKVLVLKANHFPVCGASRLLESVLAHVDRARVEVLVGSVARSGEPHSVCYTSPRTADLAHVEIPWRGGARPKPAIRALRDAIAAHGVDVVHSNDMRCDLLCALAGGSKGLGVRWVAQVHGWIGKEGKGKDRLFEIVDRCAVRSCDEVWVGSRSAEADVRRTVGAKKPVRLLLNAADPAVVAGAESRAASARESLGLPAGAFLVGTVGRLHRSKAHALLAEAVLQSGVPEMHALLLGFGPEQEALLALARSSRAAGRVHVPGPLAPERIPPLVAALDAFAFPSLRESLPLAVLEAMQLARPIASSDVGDLRFVLDDGKAGLLVPPGDVGALATALRKLHADPALRAQLGRAARERALSLFGPERLAREMEHGWLACAPSLQVRDASRGGKDSRGSGRADRRGAGHQPAVRGRLPNQAHRAAGAGELQLPRWQEERGRSSGVDSSVAAPAALRCWIGSGARRVAHAIGWVLGRVVRPRPRVLLYHGVDTSGSPISVSRELFGRQMRWLRERGYAAWPASVYVRALASGAPFPPRLVVITFDDGYRNNLEEALPELESNGFAATAFVVTGDAGAAPRWEQRDAERIAALSRRTWRSASEGERARIAATLHESLSEPLATLDEWQAAERRGLEVGSHTRSHVFCDQEPAETVRREVAEAAGELRARGCAGAGLLAWPYGQTSEAAVAVARECGVEGAFLAEWSWGRRRDGDLLRLNRVPVDARFGVFGIAFALGWGLELWALLRWWWKGV